MVSTPSSAGADDADQQSHEQGRHTHGADLLDAAADAAEDDKHSQQDEDEAVDHGLALVGHEGVAQNTPAAVQGGRCRKARAEQIAYIEHHILDAVAAQRAVEEQDENADRMPIQPIQLNFLLRALYAATAPLPVLRPMASSPTMTMKPQQTAKMR